MKAFEHEGILRLGNRRVRVATSGDGPALLLLNGIGAPVEMWQPLLPQLGHVRAIAFDAPGSGRTASGSWPLTMRGHAQLALDVLDALDCPRAAVLGFSFGGLVAQELAFSARARVERLVLASTSYGWGSLPGSLPALLGLGSPDRFPSTPYMAHRDPIADRRGRFFQAATAVSWSSAWWLWQVRQPALVVTGDLDTVVPAVNSFLLAALLPAARLHVVRGGGHLCILEQASELGAMLRDFLQPVRPRTGSHRVG